MQFILTRRENLMNHNTEELIRPKFSESEPTSPERTSSKQKQDEVRIKIADWKNKANSRTSCSLANSGQSIHSKRASSTQTTTFVTLNPQKLC